MIEQCNRQPLIVLIFVFLLTLVTLCGGVTAQAESVVEEETVNAQGSNLKITAADGASAVGVEAFKPANVSLSANDGGVVSSGGITWQGVPDDGTVSFELTPPDGMEEGETILFDVFDGDQTTTASVTVVSTSKVPVDFPADADQYNVIIEEYGEVSPITLAQVVTENTEQGNVGGVTFSPIELAQIIDWSSNK